MVSEHCAWMFNCSMSCSFTGKGSPSRTWMSFKMIPRIFWRGPFEQDPLDWALLVFFSLTRIFLGFQAQGVCSKGLVQNFLEWCCMILLSLYLWGALPTRWVRCWHTSLGARFPDLPPLSSAQRSNCSSTSTKPTETRWRRPVVMHLFVSFSSLLTCSFKPTITERRWLIPVICSFLSRTYLQPLKTLLMVQDGKCTITVAYLEQWWDLSPLHHTVSPFVFSSLTDIDRIQDSVILSINFSWPAHPALHHPLSSR